jgi:hypothetical protein
MSKASACLPQRWAKIKTVVEVIDLKEGKRTFSIPGLKTPQGVFYSAEFNKLFVATGGDGTCFRVRNASATRR